MTTTGRVRHANGNGGLRRQEARAGCTLIVPTLVVILVVIILPLAWAIMLAFQDIELIEIRQVGIFSNYTLDNILAVLTAPGFRQALVTTLIYTTSGTFLSVGIGLVAALVVRRNFRGRTIVRASMLLPYVAPVVAATFVWEVMLNPQFGIVNTWGTKYLGWDSAVGFLSQKNQVVSLLGFEFTVPIALLTVIAFEAWRYFPFAFLFLLARVQALPGDVEEAAWVDGATPLQRFRYVIFPQLWPVIAVLSVLRFIWTFNKFDDIYLLTGGGAGTEVVSVRVYNFLTARGDIGAAAAQALVLSLVLVVCVGLFLWLSAPKSKEAE